jgi:hypothetical protein
MTTETEAILSEAGADIQAVRQIDAALALVRKAMATPRPVDRSHWLRIARATYEALDCWEAAAWCTAKINATGF